MSAILRAWPALEKRHVIMLLPCRHHLEPCIQYRQAFKMCVELGIGRPLCICASCMVTSCMPLADQALWAQYPDFPHTYLADCSSYLDALHMQRVNFALPFPCFTRITTIVS